MIARIVPVFALLLVPAAATTFPGASKSVAVVLNDERLMVRSEAPRRLLDRPMAIEAMGLLLTSPGGIVDHLRALQILDAPVETDG